MIEGPLGTVATGTFVGLIAVLFTLLVNALLKTSSKSDEIAQRLVAEKEERIKALVAQLKEAHDERDYWFGKYDECRGSTT